VNEKRAKVRKKRRSAKPKATRVGTIRIKVSDLKPYEKTRHGWRKSKREFPELMHIVELFKAHSNFSPLIDAKDIHFLKGQLSRDGKCQGARVNVLPDGRKLDKAYSLFAEHLTIHDEASNQHWDVLYRNPGGTYSYVYTLGKKRRFTRKKYREVEEFERLYPTIEAKVTKALDNPKDDMAIPMYTLLKTYMRVGNEIYYKAHGNKGLTTLKKRDIRIRGYRVTFAYLSKGGIPRVIIEDFPENYVRRLKNMLRGLKPVSFVFVNRKTGHPLSDVHFKRAFERYCGKAFYPHIVRSYYATKKELLDFYRYLANKLGHKRFARKDQEWKDSYNITIHHYIEPRILDKLSTLAGK
jgi:hypothetical protein